MNKFKLLIIILLVVVLGILVMSPCIQSKLSVQENFDDHEVVDVPNNLTAPENYDQTIVGNRGNNGGNSNNSASGNNSDNSNSGGEPIDLSNYVKKSGIKPCPDMRNYVLKDQCKSTCSFSDIPLGERENYVLKSSVPPCNPPQCPPCNCPPPPDVKICSEMVNSSGSTSTSTSTSQQESQSQQQESQSQQQVSQSQQQESLQPESQPSEINNNITSRNNINTKNTTKNNIEVNTTKESVNQDRLLQLEDKLNNHTHQFNSDESVVPNNTYTDNVVSQSDKKIQMTPDSKNVSNTDMFKSTATNPSNEAITRGDNNGFCPEAMDTLGNVDYHAWGTQFT